MTARPCPSGCGRTARSGQLLCAPCWGSVPRHLQREVLSTWRAWSRNVGDSEAMTAYRAASDAAQASIA